MIETDNTIANKEDDLDYLDYRPEDNGEEELDYLKDMKNELRNKAN